MFKADIRLPIILPLATIFSSILFSFFGLSPLTIIIYIGTVYIITYYIAAYIRRKDALQISETTVHVKTPFRYKEFNLNELKEVYVGEGKTQIKAIVLTDNEEETVTICSAIYSKSIEEIYKEIEEKRARLNQQNV